MIHDVVIVGGGPAGLSAALALGRARRRVLVCDGGPRRNAAAIHLHNFVSRDGTPPNDFRRISQEQLAAYPNVEFRNARALCISGARGDFEVEIESTVVSARRLLLCTGMIDELPDMPGFRELWGQSVFQCPYCHGWEAQDRAWGYLASPAHLAHFARFAQQLRAWTQDVVVFSNGAFEVTAEARAELERAGVRLETDVLSHLVVGEAGLTGVALSRGVVVPCAALFAHPPQRHVDLIGTLGLALDDEGYVQIDPMKRETSVLGIYAAGDLTTRVQGAILAAAAGTQAAVMINLELTMELAQAGLL